MNDPPEMVYRLTKYQIKHKKKGTTKWKNAYTASKSKTIKYLKKVKGKTYYGAWSKKKLSKRIR